VGGIVVEGNQMTEYRIQISDTASGSHYWLPEVVSEFCILSSDIFAAPNVQSAT
jgi:hypothetical protein